MIYNLAQIIEQGASDFPEREAYRCMDDSITFAELHQKSDQLAMYLIRAGVKKGDRVAVYMNRCLDAPVAVFGILKAGAAYVPMDTFAPLSRSLYILEDCDIEHMVTSPSQRKKVASLIKDAPFLKSVIGISEVSDGKSVAWERVFSNPVEGFGPPRVLEQDLAFILYTSGSTGTPKAMMHTHNSALSLVKVVGDLFGFHPEDRVGIFAPLHFDMCMFGYFIAPYVGAVAIIIPDAHFKMHASLSALVEKEKITIWYSVPYVLTQVLLRGEIEKHDFSALRWVLFAGELFILKHLRALMLQWPHAKFGNLYGPAETIACTYYVVEEPPTIGEPIPIGTVWGNTEYKILDSEDRVVAPGDTGELVVRSASTMLGYWKNEELTEKAFYKLNISPGYDHLYYRTGDLMRENDKGELMFMGRNDRQLQLRGHRVELDGIEHTLLKNEDVEEAAVVAIERDEDHTELVAVVKPASGSRLNPKDLSLFCKTAMPSYAVPQSILVRNDFPRTSSGKIDRKEIQKELTSL